MATRRNLTVEDRVIKGFSNRGFITKRQLRAARAHEKVTGTKVLDTVVSSGALMPETLETMVMVQAGIRTVNLRTVEVDQQATRLVSPEYARQKCILPIGFAEGGSLLIAVQNFVPAKIVPELKRMLSYQLTFVLAIGGKLEDLIDRAYASVGPIPAASTP